jgi:hypothetical protein
MKEERMVKPGGYLGEGLDGGGGIEVEAGCWSFLGVVRADGGVEVFEGDVLKKSWSVLRFRDSGADESGVAATDPD